MSSVARPRFARAFVVSAAGFVLAACASVLGVDKEFSLGPPDGGEGGPAEAGGAIAAGEIHCALDAAPCQSDAQECCYGRNMGTDLLCVSSAPTDPCPQGTDIRCDDPSDCASGDACCITLDTSNDILSTACAKTCTGTQSVPQLALCAPGGPPCVQGSCQPLALNLTVPTFYSCK